MNTIANILLAAAILLAVDMLYLSVIGEYAMSMFARIQGSPVRFNYLAAAVVYGVMAYLLTRPWMDSWWTAFTTGAAVYAVYDFTNLAILKDYTVQFAMIDTVWGGTLFAVAHMLHGLLVARLDA